MEEALTNQVQRALGQAQAAAQREAIEPRASCA